jgi:cytochrome c oxidase accessory protein FixG
MDLVTGQAAYVAYATVGILTATTFVFGGFMREQICIYACPWPRIQAAMMDEDTITVAYREWRGEPRGKGKDRENLGDCIDCNACVNVCPVGIDIRDGQQLECITCALCIDACDDIMAKIGKPRGLIDYIALTDETREREGRRRARSGSMSSACARSSTRALVGGGHRPDGGAVHPLGYRRDGGAGAQPAIRDAVGRVDPQHL